MICIKSMAIVETSEPNKDNRKLSTLSWLVFVSQPICRIISAMQEYLIYTYILMIKTVMFLLGGDSQTLLSESHWPVTRWQIFHGFSTSDGFQS